VKVSFVIPTYNHFDLTNHLLSDIYAYSPSVDEILILDNGSVDSSTVDGVNMWKSSLPVRVVRVEENIGFIRICNWGVPQAAHENIALISNDVRIKSDLANEIRAKLTNENVLGGVLYRESTGWNQFGDRVFPYLEGWLLAFRKRTWKMLAGFNEDYAPADFEDVDFSTKAIGVGIQLEELEGDYRHLVAQTIGYSPERLAITERNRDLFRSKWMSR
jgi:GT2 family glycosyltransferase